MIAVRTQPGHNPLTPHRKTDHLRRLEELLAERDHGVLARGVHRTGSVVQTGDAGGIDDVALTFG
jgi:hypothetical protein